MIEEGVIVQVDLLSTGGDVEEFTPAGSSTVLVDTTYEFNPSGGHFYLSGEEPSAQYAYTGLDELNSLVLLESPLSVDLDESSRLFVYPKSEEKRAWVQVKQDEGEEPLYVRVPFNMFAQLPEGTRTDETGYETVGISLDGEDWYITDIIGSIPVLEADRLDEVPEYDPWGGESPSVAPQLKVSPFAAGAVQVDWEPIPGSQSYEVYASLQTPVDLVPENLAATTGGTRYTISSLNGQNLPLDGSPVYVVVRATNPYGVGPTSLEGSAVPVPADTFISALYAYLGKIEAGQIDSGQITADIAWVNGSLTIGDPNGSHILATPGMGLILYDATATTPTVELRIDGQPSVFRGKIITDDISVLNGALLQGEENTITVDAVLTLQNSIPNPSIAPSLAAVTQSLPYANIPTNYQERGLFWDVNTSQYYHLIYRSDTKAARYRTVSTSGTASASIALDDQFGEHDVPNGIVKLNNRIVVARRTRPAPGTGSTFWLINTHYMEGGWSGNPYVFPANNYPDHYMVIGLDQSSNRLVAAADGEYVYFWNSNPGDTPIRYDNLGLDETTKLTFVWKGQFDYGSEKIIVGTSTEYRVYAVPSSGVSLQFEESWPVDGASWGGAYNQTNFVSSHNNGTLKRYSNYRPPALLSRVWVSVTNGTSPPDKETEPTPSTSIILPARRYLQISASDPVSQTNKFGFYAARTSGSDVTPPPRTSFYRQSPLTDQQNLVVGSSFATSGVNPPESNQFTSGGDPGKIVSEAGGLLFRGDGYAEIPNLYGVYAEYYLNAPQVLTNGVINTITSMTPGVEDNNIIYDSGLGRFTVNPSWVGMYLLIFTGSFSASSSGERFAYIYKNNEQLAVVNNSASVSGTTSRLQVSTLTNLQDGDYVDFRLFQNSGSSLSTLSGRPVMSVSICRIF